jgi:hypothetical protein
MFTPSQRSETKNTTIMTRAIKTENGDYQMTIEGQTYTICKGGNLNHGWWIWDANEKCLGRGKSKFNCEVFLNRNKHPHLLDADVRHYRY